MADTVSLIDTGPLVAALDRSEPHHDWAVTQLESLEPPLLTCEAVLSETAFLLRRAGTNEALPLRLAERGMVRTVAVTESERDVARLRRLIEQYSNVPMSFADACLVLLAERFPNAQLLTLDSDFGIYRAAGQRAIPLLTPTP